MRFVAVLFLCAAGLVAQDPKEVLNRGVAAFKNGQYADAVTEFQRAVDIDPSFVTARLYLATALMQQYIPGAESPENQAVFQRAEAEFQRVLAADPNNKVALASLASLQMNAKRWDDASASYRKLLTVNPNDAAAYYSLAYITWAQWYPEYSRARQAAGLRPESPGPLPDPAARAALRAKWWAAIDDAIFNLNQAMANRPNNSDAMAYMNLFVRERADLRDTPEEYRRDITDADGWVRQALDAKKAIAAGGGGGGGSRIAAPPPPPPPPPPPGSSAAAGAATRIKVAGNVQEANLISQAAPVYPPLARQAQIQGVVKLAAIIGRDGRMQQLQVISGHPLLVPAAIEAVKQWVYRPTLLNGQPVEVSTVIDVNFALQ
jgi:TonB family protein